MNKIRWNFASILILAVISILAITGESLAQGSITVEKTTVPGGLTGFQFTVTGPSTNEAFSLNDGGSNTVPGLGPGVYTVTEINLPAGFDLEISDISLCGTITPDIPNDRAEIDLPNGCNLTVTFTNTGNSQITIAKETVPPDNEPLFDFTTNIPGTPNFSMTSALDFVITNVPPGTFTIEEEITNGFTLIDIECDEPSAVISIPQRTATLAITANEDITCTYTNTSNGAIILEKVTVPEGGEGFLFMENITDPDGEFTLDDGQQIEFLNVPPGEYTVTEDNPVISPGDFFLSDIVCDDMGSSVDLDTRTATIDLDQNEVITCTFTNTTLFGGLNLDKRDSPDPVVAGQDLTYTLFVINDAETEATDAFLVDTLPDGVIPVSITSDTQGVACQFDQVQPIEPQTASCDIGTLAPEEEIIITIVVTPDPNVFDEAPEIITNTALLTALPGPAEREATTQTLVNPIVDIDIEPNRERREVRRRQAFDVSFDITVNPFTIAALNSLESQDPVVRADALNVLLDVEFSDLFEVLEVETTRGACIIGSVECALGNMIEGQSATVTITFRAPDQRGEFDIIATVRSLAQSFSSTVVVNVRNSSNNNCSLAAPGSEASAPLYLLFIPLFLLVRRAMRKPEEKS